MKYSLVKHSRTLLLVATVAVFTTGCSGGIIGTATGPSTGDDLKPTYRLKTFPSKLGPKIPKTLQATNSESTQILANPDAGVSQSWQQLSPSVTRAESTRLLVQEVLTLLDTVFATALATCGEAPTSCNMPEGTVQAQYTQEIIDQLQVLVGYDASSAGANEEAPYQGKLGSWITFAEIHYEKLTDDLYDHYIVIDNVSLLAGRLLEIEWTEDASDISYAVISEDNTDISEYYRYQNRSTGQHFNFHWNTEPDDEFDPITFELNADFEDTGPVSYSAFLNGQTISGRASELEGYASAMQYELSGGTSNYFQESFSVFGELIDIRDCVAETALDVDCSFDEFESELYVSEEEFDEYDFDFDFEYAEVIVSNIPLTIFEFEVRQGNAPAGVFPNVYCHGFQYPEIPPSAETFCFVEPDELIAPVVVGFDELGNEVPLPSATIEVINSDDE